MEKRSISSRITMRIHPLKFKQWVTFENLKNPHSFCREMACPYCDVRIMGDSIYEKHIEQNHPVDLEVDLEQTKQSKQ